jgi:hypothetical protein
MKDRFVEVLANIDSEQIRNRLHALLAIAVADLDRVDLGSYKSSVGEQKQPIY